MLTFLRKLAPFIFLMWLPTLLPAAAPQRITIKGSDTMVILVQRWTEMYPEKKKVEFQVTGGGSGVGIAALINGTTDICASSRQMKPAEIDQLKAKNGSKGIEVRVARDGLSVYVHKSNPVKQLTIEQIGKIFKGEITNWKEVGGPNKTIVLYSRENNSGTYEFFKEHVLSKKDFAAQTQHMAGTAALINAVSKDPFAIGYGGAAYAKNVKAIAVAVEAGKPYVLPTQKTILNNEYPIARFLYFYLKARPEGDTKKFIDWVIGKGGQKTVQEVGYYPIKKS
ncbi:phosphate ABC transporter substrate-binding protein [soil metagenome]